MGVYTLSNKNGVLLVLATRISGQKTVGWIVYRSWLPSLVGSQVMLLIL